MLVFIFCEPIVERVVLVSMSIFGNELIEIVVEISFFVLTRTIFVGVMAKVADTIICIKGEMGLIAWGYDLLAA